jgi:uncharacterized DUF497 family protein
VRITFDPAKNDWNVAERGLAFDLVKELEWSTALVVEDARQDHGEQRLRVAGRSHGRLHIAIITMRTAGMHVISLRKANRKEVKRYEVHG